MAVFQKDGSEHILIATAPRVDFHHWSDFQDRHMLRKAMHRQMPKLWDATIGTHERMIAAKAPATHAMKHSKLSFGDRYVLPAMGLDLRNIEILGAIVCASQRARGFRLLLFVDKDTYAMWGDKDMAIGIVEIPLPDGWENKESFFLSSKDRDIAAQLVDYSFGKSSFGERMGQLSDLKSLYDLRILSDTADLVMLGSDKRGNKHIQIGVGRMPEVQRPEPEKASSDMHEGMPPEVPHKHEDDSNPMPSGAVSNSDTPSPDADNDIAKRKAPETHASTPVTMTPPITAPEPIAVEAPSATVPYESRPMDTGTQGDDTGAAARNEENVPMGDEDASDDFQDYIPESTPTPDENDSDDFQDYAPESDNTARGDDDFADYVPDAGQAEDECEFQDYVPDSMPTGDSNSRRQAHDPTPDVEVSHDAGSIVYGSSIRAPHHQDEASETPPDRSGNSRSYGSGAEELLHERNEDGKSRLDEKPLQTGMILTSETQERTMEPHDTAGHVSGKSEWTGRPTHAEDAPHARPSETAPVVTPHCHACGLPLPEGATFCIHCGTRVKDDELASPLSSQWHTESHAAQASHQNMHPAAHVRQGAMPMPDTDKDGAEDPDDGFSVIDFNEPSEDGQHETPQVAVPPVPIETRPKPAWNTHPSSQPAPPGVARVLEITRSLVTTGREGLRQQAETARGKGGLEGRDIAFALVCDQVRRQGKGEIPESQIEDALSLHSGGIVVTQQEHSLPIVMAAFAHSMSEHQVHVISEDDETARKAASFASDLVSPFDISVGFLYGGQSQVSDDVTYGADIIYGPPSEFGCDYLRHAMNGATNAGMRFDCVIIDDAPGVLVDSASVPFSIRRQGGSTSHDGEYVVFAAAVRNLVVSEQPGDRNCDIVVDRRSRRISTTANGAAKIKSRLMNVISPGSYDGKTLTQRVQAAMQAEYLLARDRDYVVRGDSILLIDPRTKTVMRGRRWSGGLQEAVEAKEGLHVREQGDVLASVAVSDYFKRYANLAGFASDADGAKRVAEAYDLPNNLMIP